MDFVILFLLVGSVYGIYLYREDIKEGYSDMGFWGKLVVWCVVLGVFGNLFG